MIVRTGHSASFLVDLSAGLPDAGVTWTLRDPTGAPISTGTIPTPAGTVSVTIPVPGLDNTLARNTMASFRDLEWSYTVGGVSFYDEVRYSIEGRVPFGASTAGVRTKLGLDDDTDLPDSEISLVKAYLTIQNGITPALLAQADPADLTIRDAIEATAAFALIPTLTVRIAQKEDSGTSSYQRQTMDWATLGTSLNGLISAAYTLLNPTYDPTVSFSSLLVLATPATDPITGSTY